VLHSVIQTDPYILHIYIKKNRKHHRRKLGVTNLAQQTQRNTKGCIKFGKRRQAEHASNRHYIRMPYQIKNAMKWRNIASKTIVDTNNIKLIYL
jgi:hypothetical protein